MLLRAEFHLWLLLPQREALPLHTQHNPNRLQQVPHVPTRAGLSLPRLLAQPVREGGPALMLLRALAFLAFVVALVFFFLLISPGF